MMNRRLVTALCVALPLSSAVVACSRDEDTQGRQALEQESLKKDLELALEPDTTVQPELSDVPAPAETPQTPPPVATQAPKPAPQKNTTPARPTPPKQTQPSRPAPAPAPSEPAPPRRVSYPVPAGTSFAVTLDETLSTKSVRAGSSFTATLSEPIRSADGTVVIPSGATVRGHVVEAHESSRAGQTPSISIAFDAVSYGGQSYSINGTATDVPVRRVTRDSKAEQAAKIGGGAAAGAVLGRVIGKSTKSTVAGAAIGAAAGTAVAMGTADVDAEIPAGSRVTVRTGSTINVTQ